LTSIATSEERALRSLAVYRRAEAPSSAAPGFKRLVSSFKKVVLSLEKVAQSLEEVGLSVKKSPRASRRSP
jgi:hypothetical protein